jgi:HlyD family secretion protein
MKMDCLENIFRIKEIKKGKTNMKPLFKKLLLFALVIVFVALGILAGRLVRHGDISTEKMPTFEVRKGPLRISVTETGTIEAREKIIIKSEVEGKTSIISLIDEGTRVKKGDLLIELDSSNLIDQKVDQEIKVMNTEATFVSARENLEVVKNQAQSDVDKAKLTYDFAVHDFDKYREGEYPNQLKEAESKITLAEEELTRAREKYEWSKKLYAEKYISETELQADELSEHQKTLDLELARNDLNLLTNYTHKRNLAQLESDVKQAKMALERTIRKAKADVVQAEANLKAKEAEYKRQQDKLQKIKDQIEKTKIYAPADGLVIYATSAGGGHRWRTMEPLEEGQQVRERQDLIHLPTSSGFNAKVGVYEASLDKVRRGLPARVTVDALPGEQFMGRVKSIAPLPDATSAFMNPDLKIYDTIIELENGENTEQLRTGMNCTAEIIVKQYKDAVYVPVQSVLRVGGKPTIYTMNGSELEPKEVELGLDNDRMIRIISGLKPGEVVSLAPPLKQASVEEESYEEETLDIPIEPPGMGKEMPSRSIPGGPGQPQRVLPGEGEQQAPGGLSGQGQRTGGNFLQRFDRDQDGKVSKDEFTGPEQVFQRFDKDGDGYITEPELPTGPAPDGGQGLGRGMEQVMDSNPQKSGGFPQGGRQ